MSPKQPLSPNWARAAIIVPWFLLRILRILRILGTAPVEDSLPSCWRILGSLEQKDGRLEKQLRPIPIIWLYVQSYWKQTLCQLNLFHFQIFTL